MQGQKCALTLGSRDIHNLKNLPQYTKHQDLPRDQHVFACTLCTNCRTGMGRISTGTVTGPYPVWRSGCRDDDAKSRPSDQSFSQATTQLQCDPCPPGP